jgi:hypothetical protein
MLAIVSLAALGASAVTPHVDDCHDSACLTPAVEHDAAAHRIVAPPTGEDVQPFHCVVCHLLRSFRPGIDARVLSAPAADAGTLLHVDLVTSSATASAVQPPLRAPPASPLVSF